MNKLMKKVLAVIANAHVLVIVISLLTVSSIAGIILNILAEKSSTDVSKQLDTFFWLTMLAIVAMLFLKIVLALRGYNSKSSSYIDYLDERIEKDTQINSKILDLVKKFEDEMPDGTSVLFQDLSTKEENINQLYQKLSEKESKIKDLLRKNEMLKEQMIRTNQSKTDMLAQMKDNVEEIKEYFVISKSHVKSSFIVSVFSCFVGITLLIFATVYPVVNGSLEVSILAGISGAIAELISATVFWVHNKSAIQLNKYYTALHENEMFLSSINLTEMLPENEQTEMIKEIIRSQLYKKAVDEENKNKDKKISG